MAIRDLASAYSKVMDCPIFTITPCYAFPFHGGIAMSNADLLPSLLFKINQNQLALEAAIMELTLWVEQRGSADVAENVRGALQAISRNEKFINMTLAVLLSPD
jgi:ABC-type amino acid transport system permease subunit